MTDDLRTQITNWLTDPNTCFLLGAGCSVCAKKPMLGELTKKVLEDTDDKQLKEHFQNLKEAGGRPVSVEDLINYLVRYREILGTTTDTDGHKISVEEIDKWLSEIKQKIVAAVADDWNSSRYHKRFLQRMRGKSQHGPRDIFSLNYDTVLEASLDELRISYTDGFQGTNRAWFDPDTFGPDTFGPDTFDKHKDKHREPYYRLFKLHGSINWTRDEDGHVRRGLNTKTDEPVVVYPSEQKYLQTQYGIYEILIDRFRARLRRPHVNNCLVVLGHSFNDDHINKAIRDAITSQGSNLTVIAFIGPEKDCARQNTRLDEFAKLCDDRFNAVIGNSETGNLIGQALDEAGAKEVRDAEFWKFEKLVGFIAGESS